MQQVLQQHPKNITLQMSDKNHQENTGLTGIMQEHRDFLLHREAVRQVEVTGTRPFQLPSAEQESRLRELTETVHQNPHPIAEAETVIRKQFISDRSREQEVLLPVPVHQHHM